jgi:tetratricopeptide (TPR) repeat protein
MMIPSATDPHAQDLARGTSPPELEVETPATSVSTIVLGAARAAEPLIRCTAPRAEEACLRARVVDAGASSDAESERSAATDLARLLAGRGMDLDTAVTLARHALSLGEDLELRQELVGWLAGLGEPVQAALLLEPLRAAASPERANAVLIQSAVLLSRGGEAQAAVDALEKAALADPHDAAAAELLGALAAAAPEVLSPGVAADRYLEAARRRQQAGDATAALENRLRAFEADPSHRGAASALATQLDGGARDDVLRLHARALAPTDPLQARAIHKERMLAALSAGDQPR